MKNLNFLLILFSILGLTIFSGCDDDPSVSDISRVTFFPTFEFEGNDVDIVECNTSYQLAPVTATENGVELATETEIIGTYSGATEFDISVADKYVITTSAVNADGFPASLNRTVWVVCTGDLVNSIEGLYTSTVARNGPNPTYFDLKYILIRKVGPDQYELSNADGGWYEFGRNLGPAYSSPGAVVTANDIPSNSFTFGPPVPVNGFGGLITITSMTVNPDTKTIVYTSDWTLGFNFTATLTQVPI